MDKVNKEKRSEIMRKIKSCGTKPETEMKCLLSAIGVRFVYQPKNPKEPDFFLPALNAALFVDSCFWHLCPEHGKIPKSRTEYWSFKLEGNRARDERQTRKLRSDGFKVVRVWEHDLKTMTPPDLLAKLRESV